MTRPQLVLLDEPTSQLDPVAGDELIWLLRRLNEEWGVSILLAEHRLERCLAAADRVVAMEQGSIAFDGAPADFLAWALDHDPALATPGAHLFSLAGIAPLPTGVKQAREILERAGRVSGGAAAPSERFAPERAGRCGTPRPRRRASGERGGGTAPPNHSPAGEGSMGRARPGGRDARRPARDRPPGNRRRAGCADGQKRGRKEHAAPHRRRTHRSSPRQRSPPPVKWHCWVRVRTTTWSGSGSKRSFPALRAGRPWPRSGSSTPSDSDPRDLSGGERQRLALAIALAGRGEGGEVPGLVALDEPTRGMDRARKDDLAELIDQLADRGCGRGRRHPRRRVRRHVRRAGRAARRRDRDRRRRCRRGAFGRLVLRHRGCPDPRPAGSGDRAGGRGVDRRRGMSWEAASFVVLGAVLIGGFAWYERSRPPSQIVALVAALAALAVAGPGRRGGDPERRRDHRHRDLQRLRARCGAGLRGRGAGGPDLELLARPGALDAVADGGLGALRRAGRDAGASDSATRRSPRADGGLRIRRESPTARCSTSR